jgi:hypothetical protein
MREIRMTLIGFGVGPTVLMRAKFVGVDGRLTDNIVRIGINYKFT